MTPSVNTSHTTGAPIGWPLLPVPDAQGLLDWPDLARSVREQIQVLLATQPGEQLMRPAFGAGLEQLLGEPNTVATRARIRDLVTSALARWEPRITVDAVAVEALPDPTGREASSAVRVDIAYRLIRTQMSQRLGLTLVMEAGHAD